eukprot:CAMPEP_0113487132 /NCGR_PEP_ID=MMETSP0014_2-20120614/25352_1 /TAXON_ID=2857 /ORGANISM="Nitzschia sp." /LENGTH=726 /DNA_ID=CAMNT_0000380821 /DNA_START=285 /DNA_END=2465 /DNA_ORIENTATION=- /assembly_acc=CAM_ASM_000159
MLIFSSGVAAAASSRRRWVASALAASSSASAATTASARKNVTLVAYSSSINNSNNNNLGTKKNGSTNLAFLAAAAALATMTMTMTAAAAVTFGRQNEEGRGEEEERQKLSPPTAAAAAAALSTPSTTMMLRGDRNNNSNISNSNKKQHRSKTIPVLSSLSPSSTWSSSAFLNLPVSLGWVGISTTSSSSSTTTTLCDYGFARAPNNNSNGNGNKTNTDTNITSFPDLSRFGSHSYLKRYLTPHVFMELSSLETTNGVTLEDLIKSGVALPYGARPPRGLGVYAGDTESYQVFGSLLTPIIEDYHHYRHIQKTASTSNNNGGNVGLTSVASSTTHTGGGGRHRGGGGGGSGAGSYYGDEDDDGGGGADQAGSQAGGGSHRRRRKRKSMLRRQFTNLNPSYVLRQQLDPTGDYILQTRMRVARSVDGFTFSPVITRKARRELEQLFVDCITNSKEWTSDDELNGQYLKVMEMSNEEHDRLIEQHILFHDPDEYNISAGIGRDWPDARGIFINRRTPSPPTTSSSSSSSAAAAAATGTSTTTTTTQPDLVIWVNKEDHLRIIATSNGGDLLGVFKRLTKALSVLEMALQERGHAWCTHPQYGFVNTSPENLGTALRASVFVKLYRLGKQPGFEDLLDRLRLESSSRFKGSHDESSLADLNPGSGGATTGTTATAVSGRYTGIFDIANAERLGQSEVQLINTMINGVGRLIELEKRLERGEKINLHDIRE